MDVRVSLPGGKAATAWRWPHFSMYWAVRNPWSSISPPPHIFTACTETAVLLHRRMIAFSYENKAKLKYGQIIESFSAELYRSYKRMWSRDTLHSGRLLWTRPRRMGRMSWLSGEVLASHKGPCPAVSVCFRQCPFNVEHTSSNCLFLSMTHLLLFKNSLKIILIAEIFRWRPREAPTAFNVYQYFCAYSVRLCSHSRRPLSAESWAWSQANIFLLNKVAMRQILLPVLQFSPVSVIPPMLRTRN
jgi:hypothetical protein